MRERAPVILGTIVIAAVALGLVIAVSGRDLAPSASAPALPDAGIEVAEGALPTALSRDLVDRLLVSLDGGAPLGAVDPESGEPVPPAEPAREPPPRPVPAAPPRPRVALGRPLSLDEQVEFAGTFHDWVILRRDEQRRRLAELEASGQGQTGPATAIRRELARLDDTEPRALARYEELAERARLGREATGVEDEAAPHEGEDPVP